jgi:hypothetical protein
VALKVCAEPGCPVLTKATRCTEHTRAKDRARGTSTERGYGAAHQRLRRSYELRMRAGEVFYCWRCGAEIDPDAWHLGHDDADRSVYRGPECVPCNMAVSGRSNRTF